MAKMKSETSCIIFRNICLEEQLLKLFKDVNEPKKNFFIFLFNTVDLRTASLLFKHIS